jgi:Na+/H+ antiporter NhaC
MASASDHIDHVRTQLPYALLTGSLTVIVYLLLGYFSG